MSKKRSNNRNYFTYTSNNKSSSVYLYPDLPFSFEDNLLLLMLLLRLFRSAKNTPYLATAKALQELL